MAQLIRQWIMSYEQCIRKSRANDRLTQPALRNPSEHITASENAMQVDLVPELPPSGGYEKLLTAMDVFSRYLFGYPTCSLDGKMIEKVIINSMTNHAYLPKTIISYKGSDFLSQVIKEVAEVLGITLRKPQQSMHKPLECFNERMPHLKKTLKIETGGRRFLWHKYLNIAVLNYNTSYHPSIGFEPSRLFHGRVPYNVLSSKMGMRLQKTPTVNSPIAEDVLKQTEITFQDVRKDTMQG